MTELSPRGILLSVEDLAATLAVLTGPIGMTVDFQDGDHFAQLSKDGFRISIATSADHPSPGEPVLMMKTDDVAAATDELAAAGADVLHQAQQGRDEDRALVRIPGGTAVSLYGAS